MLFRSPFFRLVLPAILLVLSVPASHAYDAVAELLAPMGSPRAVACKGNIAYLLTSEGSLYTFDVSDAFSQPPYLQIPPTGGPISFPIGTAALVVEDYLYVGSNDLEIVDISKPANPISVATIDIEANVWNLKRILDLLVVSHAKGVDIFAIDDPRSPTKIGEITNLVFVFAAAASQTHLYVSVLGDPANPALEIRVYDFRNPSQPIFLGSSPAADLPTHLYIVKNRLVSASTNALTLWNLANPAAPTELDSQPFHGRVSALLIDRIIGLEDVYEIGTNTLTFVDSFDSQGGNNSAGFPFGSSIIDNGSRSLILLAQTQRVLIVREDTVAPNPRILANLQDSSVHIAANGTLALQVEMNAGGFENTPMDWWLFADTSFGPFYFDAGDATWKPGFAVTFQGPLFNLSLSPVLDIAAMPPGIFDFYFGVDFRMNGVLDYDELYEDRVDVDVP